MDDPGAMVASMVADVSGTNPATGTPRYYAHDNLGSTRALWASNKSSLGSYEYTPYGSTYAATGASIATLGGAFTGKPWDPTAQLYCFPYRYYSPGLARWPTRDPLGMIDGPNVYVYASSDPLMSVDSLGLYCSSESDCPSGKWVCSLFSWGYFAGIYGKFWGRCECICVGKFVVARFKVSCRHWGVGLEASINWTTGGTMYACNKGDLLGDRRGLDWGVLFFTGGTRGGEGSVGFSVPGLGHLSRAKCTGTVL